MSRPVRLLSPEQVEGELQSEARLRPETLDDYIGQERVKDNLRVFIQAAKRRGEPLDHVLLSGPPGLGKTTLAHILARELDTSIKVTSGPVFTTAADLLAVLSHLKQGQVLFIDEVHRLSHVVEEHLYPAMEEGRCELIVDKGPNARHYSLALEPFTLVGATTRPGMLTGPMRSRFGLVIRLDYYNQEELQRIVARSARLLEIETTSEGAEEIARRARGTPRIANRLLRRARDFAEVEHQGVVDLEVARYSLQRLDIDERGLDEMDRRFLRTIIEKFGGGPVGVATLASALSEDEQTLEDVYEPYMIQEGLLARTARGREATSLAYAHLGIRRPSAGGLFD
ncbi:MAG TPA: Holliday junction branch migration DNA helicase RuvB [Candidatus Krumholzibacteria bacterium]|nr:Holliday junction branch migration DNA helicase RuvB [Candidatus Krumholzibacteria bacterium]